MKPTHLRLLAALIVILGLGLAGLAMQKTIILDIDGKSISKTTLALTVGQFLRLEGVAVGPHDQMQPTVDRWLQDGETIRLTRATQVNLRADGKSVQLLSAERLPANLLAQAGIPLYGGDRVLAEGMFVDPEEPLPLSPSHNLSVQRSIPIILRETTQDGEKVLNLASAAATLGQALWEAGIKLYTADRLSPAPQTALGTITSAKPLEVTLIRSRELAVRVDGRRLSLRSAAPTVGAALAEAGLPLQGLDYSRPAENDPLPADGKIRVLRVDESVLVEQTPLPFETEYQAAANLELDTQSILQTGEYGLVARRVRIRTEDGKEVSRVVEGEWLARPPQNRVVGYGTKIVMHTLNTPDGPIRYWRALRMWATSYSPSSAGGDTTASGKKLRKGLVGVDRNLIPFGTMMYVPDYGMAEAADTGAISGRWIDLGYRDEDYQSWHQWVMVYFLWPPPPNPMWIFP